MNSDSSRRNFLRAGLTIPAAGLALPHVGSAFQGSAAIPLRTLGKTGLKANPLGMGVGFTPDPAVVSRAVDLGVNFFDTANDYAAGNSERLLAQGLKGIRDKVIIVSKTPAQTKTQATTDLDDSLKNLQTDHVDVWLLHAKDTPQQVSDELLETFETAKKQGKIRFYGFSTHDINQMADHAIKSKVDVVLFSYNFTMGASKDAAIKKLHDAGIGTAAIKAMAATGGAMPTFGFGRGGAGGGGRAAAAPARPARIQNPLPALKWVLKNPDLTAVFPGIRDNDMLDMNLKALTEKYTAEDDKVLTARNEEVRPYYCRMCFQCAGQCPKGVAVPDQLRILAYADFYNDFPFARTSFLKLSEEARAVRCSDCSTCAVKCPNGVRVPERLIRAQEMLA
jgi:predicted aldo/keto reductase-like oxidoreductase